MSLTQILLCTFFFIHTFWMAPCLICYFIVILFYVDRKWLFMRNLALILALKSKSYYVSGIKVFWWRYAEIYRRLHSKCFKSAVLWRQEMVQCNCFFWHQAERCLLKNLQSEKQEHIIFNVKWVEVHKMSEVFWTKLYCKMSNLFR